MSRKPFQGITNIIRFNWHYYVITIAVTIILLLAATFTDGKLKASIETAAILFILVTFVSLLVSLYVYDLSGLYALDWLEVNPSSNANLINIHAGFDETSALIQSKYPEADLKVYDFYDVQKHTEVSIKRARKAYPQYIGTQTITTNNVPAEDESTDVIFTILAAHEIRDHQERVNFFRELKRTLKPTGQIIVTEHLRDINNFLAYNIGFLHFHSMNTWQQTFTSAELEIKEQIKTTPFITTFILTHNGDPS